MVLGVFTTAILKLTARCNLNCTYCYMFNLKDQTYRRVPAAMPVETALVTLGRIETHMRTHGTDRPFTIALHGGEPTLWPVRSFGALLERVARIRAEGMAVKVVMQSNGLRIPPSLLRLLAEHQVSIGISLDGPQSLNDLARWDHRGRGSYARVMRTVHGIIEAGQGNLLAGFLAVAEPSIPPAEFLDWLSELPVRRCDVLWPIQFHHGAPPWPPGDYESYRAAPRYGQWFANLFEQWWRRDDPDLVIRLFLDCVGLLLGGRRHTDSIVNDRIESFVVNTDGGIEYPDYFRTARDGGSRSAFDVFTCDLDALSHNPVFDYCINLQAHLPGECRGCPQVDLCGGGFLPGRMDPAETIPSRKSILCDDLYSFFSVVRQHVESAVIAERARATSRTE